MASTTETSDQPQYLIFHTYWNRSLDHHPLVRSKTGPVLGKDLSCYWSL